MSKLDQIRREQNRRRRFRFSLGEMFAVFIFGGILTAYGLLSAMLFGKCTCTGSTYPDQNVVVWLIQLGCALLGMWILVVTVMAIRNRND